jgi:hypothetical protein
MYSNDSHATLRRLERMNDWAAEKFTVCLYLSDCNVSVRVQVLHLGSINNSNKYDLIS